jgi:5-methylcytosine-specific restriction endonuclease McrA
MLICPKCGHGVPTAKQERREKRTTRRDVDAMVRERVFRRDWHQCCNCGTLDGLTLDHAFGRARDRSAAGCWTLCAACHQQKTNNIPSRRWWLERFRAHVASLDATKAVRVDELIAKDDAKHPGRNAK